MELAIAFIRAGACKAELAGKLVGTADEPLAQKSKQQILTRKNDGAYPDASLIFCGDSPRCIETARLIWPTPPIIVEKDLQPIDYGVFEGKDSFRLASDERFLQWVTSRSAEAFPGGEPPVAMQTRSVRAFGRVAAEMASKGIGSAAVVSHLLVLEAILQRFCVPRSNFRTWDIGYGGGLRTLFDTISLTLSVIEAIEKK